MGYTKCNGCGNIVFDDMFHSHRVVDYMQHAPTGERRKDMCPLLLMKGG